MKRSLLTFACCLALLVTGCTGGNGDGGGGGMTAEVGETAELALTAAEGGEVMLDSGAAAVNIPAGAMPEDMTISVEAIDGGMLPERHKLASSAFDFGPDGTDFQIPVTLTMAIDRAVVPSGAKLAIAWLDGDSWRKLSDSEVEGDQITATTTHFSTFAVTFTIVGGQVTQTGGMCTPGAFSACGGDPIGTWTVSESCLTADLDTGIDSGAGECEGLIADTTLDYRGTVEIASDRTYTTDLEVDISISVTYPKACLGGVEDCSAIGEEAVDAGDACSFGSMESSSVQQTGEWEASGDTLTLIDPDGSASDAKFCVSGNRLELRIAEDGADAVLVLTR